MMEYNVLDLFSGIGGMSLGLERAGMHTAAFCEIEPYCQKVLKKHWPDVPIYNDVRTITDEYKGSIDVICGGYPCQPFSTNGQRKGADDDRHLWPEMLKCIKEYKPRWVIGENVTGHINMGFDTVLHEMECAGYECRGFVIPACAVGTFHIRERIWLLGYSQHDGLSATEGRRKQPQSSIAQGQDAQWQFTRADQLFEDVSTRICGLYDEGQINRIKPGMVGMADGIPNWVDRVKCLGNTVMPLIPEIFGTAIMEIERSHKEGGIT